MEKNLLNEENVNEENISKQKQNIFSKLISKFKKEKEIDSNKNLGEYSKEYSKFREYIFLLDETEDDESVNMAIDLCDDSLKLNRHRTYLDKKKKEAEETLKELKYYERLSYEQSELFKNLISKFVNLNNEKRSMRYQLGDFDSSINKLESLKDDAYDSILQIEEAENQNKVLTRDIEIIKSEKERTELDREKLEFAYTLIYKFSFVISLILGFSIIGLTLTYMLTEQDVFIPLSILCFTLILTIAIIYTFRRKIVFELKLNEKKKAKLVALLNKKKVVYSYYLNFLNYGYKKYGVKNSKVLKSNLEDFENYKHFVTRYDNINKILSEITHQLEDFIKENKIPVTNLSLESFAKRTNVDNKLEHYRDILNKKKKLEERISEIDKEHEQLWAKLVELNLNDVSKEKVIGKIIEAYMKETEKLVFENKDIDKEAEDI